MPAKLCSGEVTKGTEGGNKTLYVLPGDRKYNGMLKYNHPKKMLKTYRYLYYVRAKSSHSSKLGVCQ